MTVTFDDVRDAHRAIKGLVQHTPILRSETLSDLTGTELYLKFENHQFTSSFKERGAANRILALDDRERAGQIAERLGAEDRRVLHQALDRPVGVADVVEGDGHPVIMPSAEA